MNNPNCKVASKSKTDSGNAPLPQASEPIEIVTNEDVILGRGSGVQNHVGNVVYRQLVFLNKELYVMSSKFDKMKISKAIVQAVRDAGGHFFEVVNAMYYDIGDKRAWEKTSQALREGQTEVRTRLEDMEQARLKKVKQGKDDPLPDQSAEMVSFIQKKQIISDKSFLQYSKRVLETLRSQYYSPAGLPWRNQDQPATHPAPPFKNQEQKKLSPSTQGDSGPDRFPNKRRKLDKNLGTNAQNDSQHPQNRGQPLIPDIPVLPDLGVTSMRMMSANNAFHPSQGFVAPSILPNLAPTSHNTGGVGMEMQRNLEYATTSIRGEPFRSNADTDVASGSSRPQTDSKDESFDNFVNSISVGAIDSLRSTTRNTTTTEDEESKRDGNLSDEIDELIQRHSAALAEIEFAHATEDLVFEEDNCSSSLGGDKEPEKSDEETC